MDTIRVTFRSERFRLVEPTRIPEDFTWQRKTPRGEAGSHLDDDEQVAQTDDRQRQEEADEEGVDDEGRVVDVLGLRPHDATHGHLVEAAEDQRGQDDQQGHAPHRQVDELGHAGLPPSGGLDGVDHGQVPIDAHHRQAEDAGELIEGVWGGERGTCNEAVDQVRVAVKRCTLSPSASSHLPTVMINLHSTSPKGQCTSASCRAMKGRLIMHSTSATARFRM
ncbi:hypothetical protein EYF80_058897 [Liparis tanakae]|uniref:Uncharacterized protein n=1 Tax=Liparis tanakae TaxID=230148 RepID=A0A4Z2EQV8_9TELE|nr:hypothetical protein EYF80_058897 [Liparis tanakae]